MKKLNNKGSSLVWVFAMLLICSVIFLIIGKIYIDANSRIMYKFREKQAYITSKTVTNLLFSSIENNDEMGDHIIAYVKITGDLKISKIELPEEMGSCKVKIEFLSNSNRLKITSEATYKDCNYIMVGYMIRKYRLYDKDDNLVDDDYQGNIDIGSTGGSTDEEDDGEDLSEYHLEEYWVVSEYDNKR